MSFQKLTGAGVRLAQGTSRGQAGIPPGAPLWAGTDGSSTVVVFVESEGKPVLMVLEKFTGAMLGKCALNASAVGSAFAGLGIEVSAAAPVLTTDTGWSFRLNPDGSAYLNRPTGAL